MTKQTYQEQLTQILDTLYLAAAQAGHSSLDTNTDQDSYITETLSTINMLNMEMLQDEFEKIDDKFAADPEKWVSNIRNTLCTQLRQRFGIKE